MSMGSRRSRRTDPSLFKWRRYILLVGAAALYLSSLSVQIIASSGSDIVGVATTNIQEYYNNRSRLTTCKRLMQQQSHQDGSFLTQTAKPVVWKIRHDGSRELTLPKTCRIKKYSAKDARNCLSGKSLLFVGDSLTRFLFLSLAYFIEHGKWPPNRRIWSS